MPESAVNGTFNIFTNQKNKSGVVFPLKGKLPESLSQNR